MDATQISSTTLKILGFIPKIIVWIREIISKGLDMASLPSEVWFPIIALVLSLYLALKIVRQWSLVSVFTKGATFLNYLLIALLIFIALTYVGAGG